MFSLVAYGSEDGSEIRRSSDAVVPVDEEPKAEPEPEPATLGGLFAGYSGTPEREDNHTNSNVSTRL